MMENAFGKISKLNLEAFLKDGKTILNDMSFTAPFKVMRPFYEKKDVMSVMLLAASAGILAGDRQEIRICVNRQAHMEPTSQSYEKIHRMEEGYASRKVHIQVKDHASLCYAPLPAIPFRDADYRSEIEADLENPSAEFIMWDILTCGRAAHGEHFLYRRFQNKVTIRREGRIVYRDFARYEPKQMDMQGFGLYEGYSHLGNMIICSDFNAEDRVRRIRDRIDELSGLEGGVTQTAYGDTVIRILGSSAEKITTVFQEIYQEEQIVR